MIFPIYTNHSNVRSPDALAQSSLLSLSQMAIINSPAIIKLFILLIYSKNVKEIIEKNTYKPEVIPTLLTNLFTIFFKNYKNLPHDIEKKPAILSNEAVLNSLPSFVKMICTICKRGLKKNFRFNPMSHYRVLSNFGILESVEEFFSEFVSNYIYHENNEPTESEDSKTLKGFKKAILDETKQLFKIFTVVPINYSMFKMLETCLKVDETKSTTKHPISEELIVAITCFNFFKLLIDIAEKIIIPSIIKELINTNSIIIEDTISDSLKTNKTDGPLLKPSASPTQAQYTLDTKNNTHINIR